MSKLTLETEGENYVVVTRRFAAPPEAVYRAHTDPKLVQKWMSGPEGMEHAGVHLRSHTCGQDPVRVGQWKGDALAGRNAGQSYRNEIRTRRQRHADDHAHDAARS